MTTDLTARLREEASELIRGDYVPAAGALLREAADALEQAEKALYELRIDATTVTESGIEMPAVILAAVKSMARHAREALAALDGQERGGR